ncbi:MAG TPA: AAA family ATPase, partial [Burkholderiaceae bacterium]|nr:AAA family ATPase [Burkholderiaceae bacterium]
PAGRSAHLLRSIAFHPFGLTGNAIDDYREKRQDEVQFAAFLRDKLAVGHLRKAFSDDADLFYALEALDVSDLIRDLNVWVTRKNNETGDIEYSDLSDGERQLLMVMGLLRIARGKRVLCLLDEPDTHLNPYWQLRYLRLIEKWTGTAADADNSHIVLTSHNPLTIAGLLKNEVRILHTDPSSNQVLASQPFVDPKGLGIAGVLTDIFGMPSTLDEPTQNLIDERNKLVRLEKQSPAQIQQLEIINSELQKLGFMYEERDELYREFLRKLDDVELADSEPLSPEQVAQRDETTRELVEKLLRKP